MLHLLPPNITGGELAILCPLTQRLGPKFYILGWRLFGWRDPPARMEAKRTAAPARMLRFFFG